MLSIHTLAKGLFYLSLLLGLTGIFTVMGGGATPLGLLVIVSVLAAPYLYLQFTAGKESSEQTAA